MQDNIYLHIHVYVYVGQYFSSSSILDKYTDSLWSLYKGMRDDTKTPTLRDLLFFIKVKIIIINNIL